MLFHQASLSLVVRYGPLCRRIGRYRQAVPFYAGIAVARSLLLTSAIMSPMQSLADRYGQPAVLEASIAMSSAMEEDRQLCIVFCLGFSQRCLFGLCPMVAPVADVYRRPIGCYALGLYSWC